MLVAGKMSCVESHVIVAWLLHTCTLPALRFATAPLLSLTATAAAAAAVTTPRLWHTVDLAMKNKLVLFLTEEAQSQGRLQARKLGQTPSCCD